MGMDVSGIEPTAEVGRYFRNSVWWWHPLWSYVEDVAADVVRVLVNYRALYEPEFDGPKTYDAESGHFNDCAGLDAEGAAALAAVLTAELDSGRTAEREAEHTAYLDSHWLKQQCSRCGGTGKAPTDSLQAKADAMLGGCYLCGGRGEHRPETDAGGKCCPSPFSADNVARFSDFVAASGGFLIT
jgi:hypothetical protein